MVYSLSSPGFGVQARWTQCWLLGQ